MDRASWSPFRLSLKLVVEFKYKIKFKNNQQDRGFPPALALDSFWVKLDLQI
jgi:hypothetical protein